MSSPRKPDDFDDISKTTPFIDRSELENRRSSYESEWEKTSYYVNQPQVRTDFEKDFSDEIDKTKAYVLPNYREETPRKTSPTKVQKSATLPSTKEETKESKVSNSILYAMIVAIFLLLSGVLIVSYLLFSKKYGFDIILVGAHPNSDVFVNGIRWGISSSDGSIRLLGLKAGEYRVEVKNPNYLYDTEIIRGNDGEQIKATLKFRAAIQNQPKDDECANIRKGEFEKAARCANEALDRLGDKFSIEELLRAMNLYIVNFDSGKYDIKPQDMKFLEKAAGYIKKLPPNVKIEVGGHTDNVGNDLSNLKLSENRAKAVRDALVSFGVNPDMLETRGYGETKPKASNDTEDGRFQNRRIEYTAIIRNQ
ncbi:MAG: OmpA family protein [Pyrinomonadaceae bacterium]|nr:OmpA family protein [Pyrinomonadaceae bacterium]MCX7640964.1 OmpA family protein [Pyrinomonadaceae bacterium]MDW8305113.1 OmpA family protein [Acidobacteriota bacterium]